MKPLSEPLSPLVEGRPAVGVLTPARTPRGDRWLAGGLAQLLDVPRHDVPSAVVWLLRTASDWLGLQGAAFWDCPRPGARLRQLAAIGSLTDSTEPAREVFETKFEPSTIGHLTLIPLELKPEISPRAVLVLDHGESTEWTDVEQTYQRQLAKIFTLAIESAGLQTQAAAAMRAARRDALTDLPNRLYLQEHLSELVSADGATPLAVLLLDLDHFKEVNDVMGHDVGDRLLLAVAKRLRGVLRDGDFAVRLGGDEFVVVMRSVGQRIEIAQLARRLTDEIADVRVDLSLTINVTTSIGIALFPEHGTTATELLKAADRAMYDAKQGGRNTFRFDRGAGRPSSTLTSRLSIASHLRDAIDEGLLRLVYQPQVDLRSGRVGGVEALLRVNHPTLGSVAPETLAAIAEDTSLIEQITPWGLSTACAQALQWRRSGLHGGEVAVNVPASMVQHPRLVWWVSEALEQSGLPPSALVLELTERLLIRNFALAEQTLRNLNSLGVRVAIDDFGVGYSALSYLHRLPVDRIKLDRTFVEPLPGDVDCATLVSGVLRLARELPMSVVAEGVESVEQARWLAEAGCTFAQGYLFAPPLSPQALESYLTQPSVQPDWMAGAVQRSLVDFDVQR